MANPKQMPCQNFNIRKEVFNKVILFVNKILRNMNKTIISIEVQDNGSKEATLIVTGERNNQILFEEQFEYENEEKHPLRLHLLIDKFLNDNGITKGENMAIPCITKLLNDIKLRSKIKANADYRVRLKDCNIIHLHGRIEIENFFRDEFEGKEEQLKEYVSQLLQYPNGTQFSLPSQYLIDGFLVNLNRKVQEVVIYHN